MDRSRDILLGDLGSSQGEKGREEEERKGSHCGFHREVVDKLYMGEQIETLAVTTVDT